MFCAASLEHSQKRRMQSVSAKHALPAQWPTWKLLLLPWSAGKPPQHPLSENRGGRVNRKTHSTKAWCVRIDTPCGKWDPGGLPASGFPSTMLMCWRQPLSKTLHLAWAFWAAPRSSLFPTSTDHSFIFCCASHTAARRQGQRCRQPTWDHGARGKHPHRSLADPCAEGEYLRKHVCTSGFEPKAKPTEMKVYFWVALSLRPEVHPGQNILVMSYFSASCILTKGLLTSR